MTNYNLDGEPQASFRTLLDKTLRHDIYFAIRGADVFLRCADCDALFAQTDDGKQLFHDHEMEHGRPHVWKPEEMDGKTLRLFVVQTESEFKSFSKNGTAYDIYGQDDQGVVFHLLTVDGWGSGSWKWKRSPKSNSQLPTPNAQASPSNG